MQMNLNPAGRLLDRSAGVVRSPALDEGKPHDAQSPQVVHSDAGRCRQTCRHATLQTHMDEIFL